MNTNNILETIKMIEEEKLDIRTITMGISLLDCINPDIDVAAENVYNKIVRCAGELVPTCEKIEKELGIPIINKRVSVTPIALLVAACEKKEPVKFALALEKAANKMINYYRCNPENIEVYIWPSIRRCHFEVDRDVKELCEDIFGFTGRTNDFIEKGGIITPKLNALVDDFQKKGLVAFESYISKQKRSRVTPAPFCYIN